MKNNIKLTVFVVAIFVSSLISAENRVVVSQFGDFNIEELEHSVINSKRSPKIYTITYKELNTPVTVEVYKNKGAKDFVVRSEGFEVQYTKGGNGFGVRSLDQKYAKKSAKDYSFSIDRSSFLYQRIITLNNKSEADYVKLIACYLPELVTK